jgi:hypothetical protein
MRRKGGERRIGQALTSVRARPRPVRLGMLLLIGNEGRARQFAKILEIFAHAVRPSLAIRARRLVSARAHQCNPHSADHSCDVLVAKPLGARARECLGRALDHAGGRAQRLGERRRIAGRPSA